MAFKPTTGPHYSILLSPQPLYARATKANMVATAATINFTDEAAGSVGASVGYWTPGTSNSEGGHGRSEVEVKSKVKYCPLICKNEARELENRIRRQILKRF